MGEIVNNLILLQYQFDGLEHPIKALPHGNSKSGNLFFGRNHPLRKL